MKGLTSPCNMYHNVSPYYMVKTGTSRGIHYKGDIQNFAIFKSALEFQLTWAEGSKGAYRIVVRPSICRPSAPLTTVCRLISVMSHL